MRSEKAAALLAPVLLQRCWNERHNTFSVYRVQRQKLFKHEEQKEYDRKASAEEILQAVQETYSAQGDKGIKNSEK